MKNHLVFLIKNTKKINKRNKKENNSILEKFKSLFR